MASRHASMLSLFRLVNSSRALRSRLKSCTTLIPEMYSCKNALMRAIAVRILRFASRTYFRKTIVTTKMNGNTAKAANASLRIDHEQNDGHNHEQEEIVDHGHDARGKQIVQGVHVRGHARHQPPHRVPVEIRSSAGAATARKFPCACHTWSAGPHAA